MIVIQGPKEDAQDDLSEGSRRLQLWDRDISGTCCEMDGPGGDTQMQI